ncbi:MAG: selenocysteine-specific translation elongation factor [Candidatus Promineifilaceae bacterium]
MYVIGTAGHVDHGKSTLVEALTGLDPDRLKEEKEREMTIDLGFAWIKLDGLPDEVGIVDVPGHRDFIENMLAGVGGIDLALFVVAADEGVMPQTREHLAILDLLEVQSGVVALTKVDLVDDPDWLMLVTLDLADVLGGTVLEDAPVVPVSAQTGEGLDTLRAALAAQLLKTETRPNHGRPRLPIDRIFTLSGFGTIVTGTLTGGSLSLGDAIEIQPSGLKGRVRGLQTHRTKLEKAQPGSRVAVNLTGIGTEEINRGDVLCAPGVIQGTVLCDVVYRHLPDAGKPLKHNVEVKLHTGSAEIMARTRVIGSKQIEPGQEGWLQLVLSEPTAVLRGDHFILRRPSPGQTIGGGRILDPHPGRKHRRFTPEIINHMETLSQGTPAELLLQTIRRLEPVTLEEARKRAGMAVEVAEAAYTELIAQNGVIPLERELISYTRWQQLNNHLTTALRQFHAQYPLRAGMSREELRSRLKVKPAVFQALLEQAETAEMVKEAGPVVRLPDHVARFTPEQQTAIDAVLSDFQQAGINSPPINEVKERLGEDVYYALVEQERLIPIGGNVVYTQANYHDIIESIRAYLQKNGRINAAQLRDLLGTSRKYAISLLEHLDQQKITRREGDERKLW